MEALKFLCYICRMLPILIFLSYTILFVMCMVKHNPNWFESIRRFSYCLIVFFLYMIAMKAIRSNYEPYYDGLFEIVGTRVLIIAYSLIYSGIMIRKKEDKEGIIIAVILTVIPLLYRFIKVGMHCTYLFLFTLK